MNESTTYNQQEMYNEYEQSSLLDDESHDDDSSDEDEGKPRQPSPTTESKIMTTTRPSSTSSTSSQPHEQSSSTGMSKFLDCGNSTCASETIQDLMNITPRRLKNITNKNKSNNTETNRYNFGSSPSPYNYMDDEFINNEENHDEDDGTNLDDTMPFSDLSDPTRNIWIVTTAALPWRTGTAINPFLRALYLVKRRLDLGLYDNNHASSSSSRPAAAAAAGKVTLVIPWLIHKSQSDKLFGPNIITSSNRTTGQNQQIEWIKNYAIQQCNMEKEMNHLHILFYDATYWPAFGSIFPSVDICNLIPKDEADVAILEEPEHLNWFRVPTTSSSTSENIGNGDRRRSRSLSPFKRTFFHDNDDVPQANDETKSNRNIDDDTHNLPNGSNSTTPKISSVDAPLTIVEENTDDNDKDDTYENDTNKEQLHEQKQHELGWTQKFKFVVGIIHTNYSAYMKQYGIGSSIIGAPALSAISTMVVRAYCHKVIRLSAVIPSYAKWKECTCNVHGVRGDFLEKDSSSTTTTSSTAASSGEDEDDYEQQQYAPIYFIGKLLWAKGFDKMLKVQELYRESNANREYFSIDVYGGGPDETAICRAFHGRLQNSNSSPSKETVHNGSTSSGVDDRNMDTDASSDATSPSIFVKSTSIRKHLMSLVHNKDNDDSPLQNDVKSYINMGFEVVDTNKSTAAQEVVVMERKVLVSNQDEVIVNPLSIISEVSGDIAATGIATTEAMKNLADIAAKTGMAITFSQDDETNSEVDDIQSKPSFIFDPPKSLFELRRNPIPARFLGVKDHALLRNLPHKIFLNPSVTEVLCTTTAEALAMGKFVIIPNHPSNEFFLQFPNCLAYQSLRECVEKIKWALENDPEPLSEEHAHIFTWEAATDRLIQSSFITKREAKERRKDGHDKGDLRMAWLHSEGGKKGHFIKTLFGKGEKDRDDVVTNGNSTP